MVLLMVYFESKGIVESRRDDELETEKGAENTRNNSEFEIMDYVFDAF